MDAAHALADLTEISAQIDGAVLADASGALVASTFAQEERGKELARAAAELLAAASEARADGQELVQVQAATPRGSVFVVRDENHVVAATVDDERAGRMAGAALELFRRADEQREQQLVQLDAALGAGSVFLVRDEQRTIAATTGPEPTVGLVFYDLKSCLRSFTEDKPKPKPRPRRAKKDEEAGASA